MRGGFWSRRRQGTYGSMKAFSFSGRWISIRTTPRASFSGRLQLKYLRGGKGSLAMESLRDMVRLSRKVDIDCVLLWNLVSMCVRFGRLHFRENKVRGYKESNRVDALLILTTTV